MLSPTNQLSSRQMGRSARTYNTESFQANLSSEASSSLSESGTARSTRNSNVADMDMVVDELVEQALVDNLLDGNIYSSHASTNLLEANSRHSVQSNDERGSLSTALIGNNSNASEGVSSGTGSANTSMIGCDEDRLSANDNDAHSCREDFINIFVRFVNEREIKLRVKPDDTISFLKR